MFTFLKRLVDSAEDMDYHGVIRIKRNNTMAVSASGWHRGIHAGFYHVWANEYRGVFMPQHTNIFFAFLVFPGV